MILLAAIAIPSLAQDNPYRISISGSITTSSKVFYRYDDPDEFLRGRFFPIDNIFSFGADLRRSFEPIGLEVGVAIEYISKSERFGVPENGQTVPVFDGFVAIPIELSGYFFIPIGSEKLKFYMGGGGGIYPGERRYSYAGVQAPAVGRSVGIGIHILSGAEYTLSHSFSLRSELKFRDVQFETVNKFSQYSAVTSSGVIGLPQDPLLSRVNIDGMNLSLGIAYRF